MQVVLLRIGKAAAKRTDHGVRAGIAHIEVPLGHGQHRAHTSIPQGRWHAQRIAVEGVELDVQPQVSHRFDQQCQIVAPVARHHRLGAAGADFGGIGQEVLHPAHWVQLLANDLNVWPLGGDHLAGPAHHLLTKAVILANEVGFFQTRVGAHHVGQGVQAHVRVGVEAEVPKATPLVRQTRIDG